MKKRIVVFIAALMALMFTLGFSALTVSAEESGPSVSIEKFNLAFENDTHLKYAVKFTGIDDSEINYNNIGMLYWTDYDGGFTPGTENYSTKTTGYTTIDGQKYYAFEYDNLAAKQLTDYVYSIAYLEYGGETYYSEPVKYSALEYAYNRLGKTDEGTTDTELITILNNMLTYGASAQEYFDYKEDRLATDDFYQITLVGGTLDDGFTSGLYLSTDEVTITAPAELDGKAFSAWQNSVGETVSTVNPAIITNFTANETYTATYTETSTYSEGLEYTLNDDGESYSVTGIGTCTDTEIIIPSTYEGKPVTSIGGYAFEGCASLTSIVIPDSVTSIERGAFQGCSSLASVVIPDSVTSIGGYAFEGCTSLTSIVIPDSVTSIGDEAFRACTSLTSVEIPNGVTSIGVYVFVRCSSLASVVIPNSVTSIERGAFQGCSSLASVVIPDSVTSIGESAFLNCTSLTNISINENNPIYKSIDGNLYSKDCKTLIQYAIGKTDTSFTIPDSVTSIGDDAFYNCTRLTSITIPNSITKFGNRAFSYCSSLVSVNIPDDITEIGWHCFSHCISLADITIPHNVTTIGGYAFDHCSSLTSVVIPDSVTSIGYFAFSECSGLTSITMSDSVTSVFSGAFSGCSRLVNVDISNGITEIYSSMFKDCISLTNIIIPDNVTYIGSSAFYGCSSLSNITISTSVISIEDYAFQNCKSLTTIIIPDSVTSIGVSAFQGCSSLESIIMPDSITSIRSGAFSGCAKLTEVSFEGDIDSWCRISFVGGSTANPVYYSKNILIDGKNVTEVTIPTDVTEINGTFAGFTDLETVTIHNGVIKIGSDAFHNCTSLTDVYYNGTEEEWTAVYIGSSNDPLTNATIHYNYVLEE